MNTTIVAHLDAKGKPTASVYVNDTSKISAGQARLTVRHDAAAPAVDVRADKKILFAKLTNPNVAKAEVPAGTYSADVVVGGTASVVLGPVKLVWPRARTPSCTPGAARPMTPSTSRFRPSAG